MSTRPQSRPVRVSIVIPTKNEELTIESVVGGCAKVLHGIKHEIVVVDASSDSTPERAVRRGATLIKQVGHGGLGEALLQGFNSSRGQCIVFLDGDGTYDPRTYLEFLNLCSKARQTLLTGTGSPTWRKAQCL